MGEIKVGDGATILHYSDRTPATVVSISKSGKKIEIQEDNAFPLHKGMTESQNWKIERNEKGRIHKASLRKDGQWRISDYCANDVLIGKRMKYYDYSF